MFPCGRHSCLVQTRSLTAIARFPRTSAPAGNRSAKCWGLPRSSKAEESCSQIGAQGQRKDSGFNVVLRCGPRQVDMMLAWIAEVGNMTGSRRVFRPCGGALDGPGFAWKTPIDGQTGINHAVGENDRVQDLYSRRKCSSAGLFCTKTFSLYKICNLTCLSGPSRILHVLETIDT